MNDNDAIFFLIFLLRKAPNIVLYFVDDLIGFPKNLSLPDLWHSGRSGKGTNIYK